MPALFRALWLSGSKIFALQFSSTVQAKSTTISKKIDLPSIPEEYHKYADVFSKSKAEPLTPYCSYDLRINLEKDSHPLVGTIYSLSKFEQETLKEFINKNLTNGFICSTLSSHGTPVLFVKKKDGSLWLCRFPWTQQNHKKRLIPTSPHIRPPRFSPQGSHLHQNRPPICIPFGLHCRRRRMENRLPYSLWSL